MVDVLNANGLQTKTAIELLSELTAGLKAIYGNDINLNSNSPDGQLINIIAQTGIDIRELLTEVYNSMDPDNAVGYVLDQRAAYNNIKRTAGTYTIQPIDITTNRTVTLEGLDSSINDPNGAGYTIADDAGNQFILTETTTMIAGTGSLNFRARNIGRVETIANTITNPVTIVQGVVSVNNSEGALEIGEEEETDVELRIRREKSVAIGSTAFIDGLTGYLLSLDGVTEAIVYENDDDEEDDNNIPAHGVWVIVKGGDSAEIAQAIYTKKTPGTNMKGGEVENITTINGSIYPMKFDRPLPKDLHIQFDIQTIVAGTTFDEDSIKAYIANNFTYSIGEYAETSLLTAVAKEAIENYNGSDGVPINLEISTDGATWVDYLTVDLLNEQWTISTDDITILVIE